MSVGNGGNDVTFYRCIVAEGLSNSIHGKGEHSCGSLVYFNSKNVSIIGSLYAHNFRRHPRLVSGSEVLFANNVVYNYGIYASHIGPNVGAGNPDDPGVADFIGNAYFKGVDGWEDYMVEAHKGDFDKNNAPANGKAYMEDNIGLDRVTGSALIQHDEYVTILNESGVMPDSYQPYAAYDNIELVLKRAGARPRERSETDARIVQTLIDGTGSIIDSQQEVGGYPELDSTARVLVNIPSTLPERKEWLDSISATLEEVPDLDVSPLYAFIDENLATGIKPSHSILLHCYPNPATNIVNLTFRTAQAAAVQLYLTDMTGRRIPLQNRWYGAGLHQQQFHLDEYGVPSGSYLMVLTDGTNTFTEKIMIGP
jgi:hypothetical protein